MTGSHQDAGTAGARPSGPPGNHPGFAPVTGRAVLLGLLGAVLIAVLQLRHKIDPRTTALPLPSALTLLTGPVFWLFLLAVANALLRRWRPGWALRPAEFAVVYGVSTVAAAISSQDAAMQLWPMFVFPFRESQELPAGPYRSLLPHWLAPRDPAHVEPYYIGGTSLWSLDRIAAWLVPLGCWMAWLVALGATMWAWNVLLRRRWVEHDRLSFPSVRLPLEMCRAGGFGGMLSGRLFWGGTLLAAGLESLAQLNERFPAIPAVPLDYNASLVLQQMPEPWNALAPMHLSWATLHLGICYFIPLDILFSGWFFYLFRKGLELYGFTMGWRDLGWDAAGFPYNRSQATGAWIALFFLLVWAERHHLGRALAAGFSRRVPVEDEHEPGSYRWAARILVAGTLFLVWWSVQSGMSLTIAIAFYAFFWMLHVTMTRVFAQVGPPFLELYFLDPQKALSTMFGTVGHSPRALTLFSLMYWIVRTDRGHPMGHQLSAFYIGSATGVAPRALGRWALIAFVVGAFTCLVAYLHFVYRVGEDQFKEGGWRETFSVVALARLNEWVKTPKGPQWTEIGFMGVGGLTTLVLAKLGNTFIGFPFHPIGFALAMVYTLEYNWPAFFGIWLLKLLALRYGGRNVFVNFAPFFLGLVLGGVVTPVLWGIPAWAFRWYA